MEIEAKFRIDDPALLQVVAALRQLGPYTLAPAEQVEQQRNIYYDTADGRLRAAHYGLRIRQIDARSIATLKGPNQVRDGIHQRAEWEIEATSPDPATWPEGPARQTALAALGAAGQAGSVALQPLLTIETTRQHITAAHAETPVAELSLDSGEMFAATRRERFCELEIELLPGGTHTDLEALVNALREHLPLVPENRSKLERGLALLEQKHE